MNNVRGLYPPLYGATPSGGGGGGGQHIQVDALPEASLQYKDKIVQYVGATTETLTNGYFYKCVEHTETAGETITVTYSWDPVAVMESPTPPSPFGSFKVMEVNVTTTDDLHSEPNIIDFTGKTLIDFIGSIYRPGQGYGWYPVGYCYKGLNDWSWNIYQSDNYLRGNCQDNNTFPAGCVIKGIAIYKDN